MDMDKIRDSYDRLESEIESAYYKIRFCAFVVANMKNPELTEDTFGSNDLWGLSSILLDNAERIKELSEDFGFLLYGRDPGGGGKK